VQKCPQKNATILSLLRTGLVSGLVSVRRERVKSAEGAP